MEKIESFHEVGTKAIRFVLITVGEQEKVDFSTASSEIGTVILQDFLPPLKQLTYPSIYPPLFQQVFHYLQFTADKINI